MVTPSAGTVVLVSFPFSDLSSSKLRPAVVLCGSARDDWILCQITSNPYADPAAIEISGDDFKAGSLKRTSYARPSKLFTANASLMANYVGELSLACHERIIDALVRALQAATSARSNRG